MRTRRTPRRPGLDDPRYRTNRERLKHTGNHVCHHCGYPIDLQITYPHPLSWSADHATPRAHLTPNDPRNWHIDHLLEAHLRCNQARGAKPLPAPTPTGTVDTSIEW